MKIKNSHLGLILIVLAACLLIGPNLNSMQITCAKLRVDGPNIKDEFGNVVILKGVNDNCMVDYPSSGRWMGSATWDENKVKQHLDTMKSWGVNCLRQIQPIKCWKINYDTGVPYRSAVKRVVELCNERGIYYVFNPWTVGQGQGDGSTQDPMPYPPYQTSPGASSVITSEQDFIDYWVDVANQLKVYPNVLFDLWNEPNADFDNWIGNGAAGAISVTQRLITAIRATGAENIIIEEGRMDCWMNLNYPPPNNPSSTLDWALSAINNIHDPLNNIVYSTHLYRSGGAFHYTVPSRSNAYNMTDIQKAFQYFKFSDVVSKAPLYIGELGASLSASDYDHELEAFENMLTIFDQEGIHYSAFWWREIGIYRLITNDFKTPTASGQIVQNHLKGQAPVTYYTYPHFSPAATTAMNQLKNQQKPYVLTQTRIQNSSVTVTSITKGNTTITLIIDGTGTEKLLIFCAGYGQPQVTGATIISYNTTGQILEVQITFQSPVTVNLTWPVSLDTSPPAGGVTPPTEPSTSVGGSTGTSPLDHVSQSPYLQDPLNIGLIIVFVLIGSYLLLRKKVAHD